MCQVMCPSLMPGCTVPKMRYVSLHIGPLAKVDCMRSMCVRVMLDCMCAWFHPLFLFFKDTIMFCVICDCVI